MEALQNNNKTESLKDNNVGCSTEVLLFLLSQGVNISKVASASSPSTLSPSTLSPPPTRKNSMDNTNSGSAAGVVRSLSPCHRKKPSRRSEKRGKKKLNSFLENLDNEIDKVFDSIKSEQHDSGGGAPKKHKTEDLFKSLDPKIDEMIKLIEEEEEEGKEDESCETDKTKQQEDQQEHEPYHQKQVVATASTTSINAQKEIEHICRILQSEHMQRDSEALKEFDSQLDEMIELIEQATTPRPAIATSTTTPAENPTSKDHAQMEFIHKLLQSKCPQKDSDALKKFDSQLDEMIELIEREESLKKQQQQSPPPPTDEIEIPSTIFFSSNFADNKQHQQQQQYGTTQNLDAQINDMIGLIENQHLLKKAASPPKQQEQQQDEPRKYAFTDLDPHTGELVAADPWMTMYNEQQPPSWLTKSPPEPRRRHRLTRSSISVESFFSSHLSSSLSSSSAASSSMQALFSRPTIGHRRPLKTPRVEGVVITRMDESDSE